MADQTTKAASGGPLSRVCATTAENGHSDRIADVAVPAPTDAAVPPSAVDDARPSLNPADVAAVRIAQPEDIDGVMALARLMHGEVGIYPINEVKVRQALLDSVRRGLIGVIGHPRPYACLCLSMRALWYSDEPYIGEFMFFVHPEHRKSNYARSLIAWAKFVSDKLQMPLALTVFNTKKTASKVKFCERQLENVGALFMHNRKLAQVPNFDAEEAL